MGTTWQLVGVESWCNLSLQMRTSNGNNNGPIKKSLPITSGYGAVPPIKVSREYWLEWVRTSQRWGPYRGLNITSQIKITRISMFSKYYLLLVLHYSTLHFFTCIITYTFTLLVLHCWLTWCGRADKNSMRTRLCGIVYSEDRVSIRNCFQRTLSVVVKNYLCVRRNQRWYT